jgi:amidophosphoribosyltransferase
MPYVNELVAHNRTINQIQLEIGADKLIYQSLDDLIDSVKKFNSKIDKFDCSCFNGEYITEGVNQKYLDNLKYTRKSND